MAQASRGKVRGVPPARQSFDWPELPTELTSWRYTEEAYRILIEPPVAGTRRVHRGTTRDVGLIRGYELEEGGAAQSSRYSGPTSTNSTGDSSSRTISTPSNNREKEIETSEAEEVVGQHIESSQTEDDDAGSDSASGDADANEGSEAKGDDNSGFDSDSASGSNSGADGDSFIESVLPRKRTKRASRA
ncbi:zinc finger CCHC domain-containing protein 10-like [Camellia sinensis]|uniref:zinc finger CCHC domain-containing protein 10-like n=1 Tax=Camellia sinensis TaxID=4442 RepID=UPI001036658A|nr:zinc finger CCHC domain-containing protein 10-like [Camellia sinensis]